MLAWLAVAAQLASPTPEPLLVRPGEIASGVRCVGDPKFSYELYVPPGFRMDREWPILYVYDPRGRGRLAAELFRPGAAARGFLVASSNDTESDNPGAPNAAAIQALWNDTNQRLPIAPKRRYAAGFSGGARLACSLGLAAPGELAGVFAAGGGFPPSRPPRRDLPFAVFGSVGTTDFNYYEMRQLDATLEKLGAVHRLEVFDGEHGWPPEAIASQGLEWFDLVAMRSGALARDPALVEAVWARETARARGLQDSGRPADALEVLTALVRDLGPLRDTAAALAAASALGKAATVERERREKLDRRDAGINARNDRVIASVGSGEEMLALGRVLGDLEVPRLLEERARPGYDGESARRRLAHISVQTSFYVPRQLMEQGEWRRAILLLQVATTVQPDSAFAHWQLARAQARGGSRKDALAALERAVELGLRLSRARVSEEADLATLRSDPAFARILEKLAP